MKHSGLLLLVLLACSDGTGNNTKPKLDKTEHAFSQIYQAATWSKNDAGTGNSGTGSTARATTEYRALLQRVLAERGIRSVVDAGCGDWEFSQLVDWTGVDYKGYDIVEAVVAEDTKRFAKPGIQFFVGNIVTDKLPAADLLISKHVLQHLPDNDVIAFLKKLPDYKYALITNGVEPSSKSARHAIDIEPGGYRPLDITKPPFNIVGEKVLTYTDDHHFHQVVLVTRDSK
ncbi:MAG TPA: methyltransferase [Kofleriaceae bacterium]